MSTTDKDTDTEWTLEITPRDQLVYVPFRDIWNYRDLLILFVRRDFVSFYKQTILGPLWFFIQPLMMTLIFAFVFGRVAGLSPSGVPTLLFYLCSITFWNYFADCLNKTATTFKDNANLFGKVYFPRIIVPLSIVISNLVKFCVQFLLFLGFYAWFHEKVEPNLSTLLLFPVILVLMGLLGLALGMIFSALTSKYRDLLFLLQFGVQLLMYGSAVIFAWSNFEQEVKDTSLDWTLTVFALNPLVSLIETIRHGFLGIPSSQVGLGYAAIFTLVTLGIACVAFNRVEKTFMDTV